jgi:hypothetical protein
MKSYSLLTALLCALPLNAFPTTLDEEGLEKRASAGCKTFKTDASFPSAAEWKALSPNIKTSEGPNRPDYHLSAQSSADVQAAMKFAAKHNIRLAILNSGHDFLGRFDTFNPFEFHLN